MKNIILINPLFQDKLRLFNIPMGLMYVGSYLSENGYNVKIFDVNNLKNKNEIYRVIKSNIDNSICFGFSVMTVQISNALELSKYIKRLDPSKLIIWGGVHPTLFPEQVIEDESIDFAVIDEGEKTLLELVKRIEKESGYNNVKGIAFKSNKTIKITDSRELMDVNNLPAVKWELLYDIEKNGLKNLIGRTLYEGGIPVQNSRGCPHRCIFCINAVRKIKYRTRNSQIVIEEIEGLMEKGVKTIYFIDENLFGSRKNVYELIEKIEDNKLDFKWFSNIRANYFRENYITLDFLKRLKKNGCSVLGIGAESGSNKLLAKLKKDIDVDNVLTAAKLLDKCEIKCNFSFMIGLPWETRRDMEKTTFLIERIRKMNPILFQIAGPQIYRPYPGSILYFKCLEKGMKEPQNLNEWAISPYVKESISQSEFKYYPWITVSWKELNHLINYAENIIFYTYLKEIDMKYSILNTPLKQIASKRCNNSNYKFPIEKYLWTMANNAGLDRILSKQVGLI